MNDTFQAVIAYRMNKAEERLKTLEAVLSQLGKDIAEIKHNIKDWKVVPFVGEIERVEAPKPIDPFILETAKLRKPDVVKKRWAELKRMTLEGKTPSQIARQFKCHHTAVLNAINRNFEPAWLRKGRQT